VALLNGVARDDGRVYLTANRTFKTPDPIRPYSGPDLLPTVNELRRIKKVKFELKGDTPALRAAVNADIARLQAKYTNYTFDVTFGINQ